MTAKSGRGPEDLDRPDPGRCGWGLPPTPTPSQMPTSSAASGSATSWSRTPSTTGRPKSGRALYATPSSAGSGAPRTQAPPSAGGGLGSSGYQQSGPLRASVRKSKGSHTSMKHASPGNALQPSTPAHGSAAAAAIEDAGQSINRNDAGEEAPSAAGSPASAGTSSPGSATKRLRRHRSVGDEASASATKRLRHGQRPPASARAAATGISKPVVIRQPQARPIDWMIGSYNGKGIAPSRRVARDTKLGRKELSRRWGAAAQHLAPDVLGQTGSATSATSWSGPADGAKESVRTRGMMHHQKWLAEERARSLSAQAAEAEQRRLASELELMRHAVVAEEVHRLLYQDAKVQAYQDAFDDRRLYSARVAMARFRQRTLSRAVLGWRSSADSLRRSKGVAAKAGRLLTRRRVDLALQAWLGLVQDTRQRRRRLEGFAAQRTRRQTGEVLLDWELWSKRARQLRVLAGRLFARRARAAARWALAGWQAEVGRRRRARRAIAAAREGGRRSLRAVVGGWGRQTVAAARRRRVVARHVCLWQHRRLLGALDRWVRMSRAGQRQEIGVRRLAARRARGLQVTPRPCGCTPASLLQL